MSDKSAFEFLSSINVNEHIEKKNTSGTELTYLSWCYAWSELKKKFPNATYEIERFENNLPYVYDEKTGYMVFTKLTVDGVTHEMWLPVMDGTNHAMKSAPYKYTTKSGEKTVQAATMTDINKTIMRCLTKNIAMFGLGLYIYAGEDFPEPVIDFSDSELVQLVEKVKDAIDKNKLDGDFAKKAKFYISNNDKEGLKKVVSYLEGEKK